MSITPFVHPITRIMKRSLDLTVATMGLIATAPLFPFIAMAVKLESPGPIFFSQQRVGKIRDGQPLLFNMIKFRSMCNDAEKASGPVWATKNDPRLTRVGAFLRKTRLDELPQFINVIKGDMSIVGPRPERPTITEDLEIDVPFYKERTVEITPGITGLAQVNQGYDETLEDVKNKLAYDLAYSLALASPKRWLAMELKIMFKTVQVMVTGRGQ